MKIIMAILMMTSLPVHSAWICCECVDGNVTDTHWVGVSCSSLELGNMTCTELKNKTTHEECDPFLKDHEFDFYDDLEVDNFDRPLYKMDAK